jgi:hypothetical protein
MNSVLVIKSEPIYGLNTYTYDAWVEATHYPLIEPIKVACSKCWALCEIRTRESLAYFLCGRAYHEPCDAKLEKGAIFPARMERMEVLRLTRKLSRRRVAS